MASEKTIILTQAQVQELRAILADNDSEEALKFLRAVRQLIFRLKG